MSIDVTANTAGSTNNDWMEDTDGAPARNVFTIAAWVKPDGTVGPQTAVGIGNGVFNRDALQLGNTFGLDYRHNDNQVSGIGSYSSNTWYFIASVYNDDGSVDCYIRADGGGASWATSSVGALTGQTDNTAVGVYIGQIQNVWAFSGIIGPIKIWDAALTSANLLNEYAYRNAQTNTGSIYAVYHFKTGALTTDSSGNGNTLTNQGATPFSADEPSDILGDDPASGTTLGGLVGPNSGLLG
jgi:hypothetical protein